VDDLLSELAATSRYSDASIRAKYPIPRTRVDILKTLFRQLSPQEAAFMTHIILKDLRPILYPSPDVTCSVSLLDFNTNAVKTLQKEHVIATWDPTFYMHNLYRVRASLDEAAGAFELPNHAKPPLEPIIGSMIQVGTISIRHLIAPPIVIFGTFLTHSTQFLSDSFPNP